MCIRFFFAGLIIAAFAATGAYAQVPAPTLDSIAAASRSAQAQHCTTADCRAVVTLHRAMNDLLNAQATAQGLTQKSPVGRDASSNTALQNILLNDPRKFPAVCRLLTQMVAHYPPGDLFVAVSALELALRMDMKTGSCLPAVLTAFPPSRQAKTVRGNAQILCKNAWKLGSACQRLRRKTQVKGAAF
jgi:hypothetical protein